MKHLFLFFHLLLLPFLSTAGPETGFPGKWSAGAHYHYGFIMAHRSSIIHLQQEHLRGFELNWQMLPSSTEGWHTTYNFPWLGFSYLNFDLGNPLELGRSHGLFPMVYFPLIRKRPLQLMLRVGWGIGYIEKPFNTEDNYKNLAIGSRINCGVNTALQFRVPANKRMQVTGGVNFTHFSNGASSMPNLGLNMTTVQMGIQYMAGKAQSRVPSTPQERRAGIEYSVSVVAGVKDIYPPGGKKYLPVNFSTNALYDVTPKSMIGGGIDFCIDPSMTPRLEEDQRDGFGARSRVGIHGSYGLHVGRMSGVLQVGTYAFNRLKIDGTIYNRLAMRYYAGKNVFLAFNLKSHFAKADYFEWGIGYSFRK